MSIIDEPHSLDGPLVHRFDFSLQYDVDLVHVVVPQEHISFMKFDSVPCVFSHISMHLLASNTTTIGLTQSVHDAFPTSFWYFPASIVLVLW